MRPSQSQNVVPECRMKDTPNNNHMKPCVLTINFCSLVNLCSPINLSSFINLSSLINLCLLIKLHETLIRSVFLQKFVGFEINLCCLCRPSWVALSSLFMLIVSKFVSYFVKCFNKQIFAMVIYLICFERLCP